MVIAIGVDAAGNEASFVGGLTITNDRRSDDHSTDCLEIAAAGPLSLGQLGQLAQDRARFMTGGGYLLLASANF